MAMVNRINEVFLFIGKLGTGKTTRALLLAKAMKKKIIIYDQIDHPAMSNIQIVNDEQLKRFNGEICRYIGHLETFVDLMLKYQSNAVVLFEDSSRYISSNLEKFMKSFIVEHRKVNFDLIFMFHFLSDVPPYMCKQYSKMFLFKTGDNPEVKQPKFANWHKILEKLKKVLSHKQFNHFEIITLNE